MFTVPGHIVLHALKSAIQEAIPDLWFQPNEVMLTPFLRSEAEFEQIADLLASHPEEILAVGDGPNDYAMFAYAGTSIGIHIKETNKVTRNARSISEALEMITNNGV